MGTGGGIYSSSQLAAHRHYQVTLNARRAVLAKVTNSATGSASSAGQLGIPLSTEEIKHLSTDLASYLIPLFPIVGYSWATISGVFLVAVILKTLAGCILRIYLTVQQKGFGWWVVGAIWSTTFHLFHVPRNIYRGAVAAYNDQAQLALLDGANQRPPAPLAQPILGRPITYGELSRVVKEAQDRQNGATDDTPSGIVLQPRAATRPTIPPPVDPAFALGILPGDYLKK
jgi:hypothetical protein